ncbi:MAG: ATP-binding cassette domain-containing protein [Actinomycetes bacterium]
MIEVRDLTKAYGDVLAVDHITFTAHPGVVTGFLGPNGAGKTTTMRMILGLDRPTSGQVLVNGADYTKSQAPIHEIGALLDAKFVDKGRSARNHLLALGATVGVGRNRVDEVIGLVGLDEVARRSAGSFSLGMGQRLGIAGALLADPAVIMLDEPVNGLDPDGILWIRHLLRQLADEGRTVLVSSHLMSEMEQTADHLIVIGRGHVLADMSMSDFIATASGNTVRVSSPEASRLQELLAETDASVTATSATTLEVHGVEAEFVGELAARHQIVLHELVKVGASLEKAFMEMTAASVQYRGGDNSNETDPSIHEGQAA